MFSRANAALALVAVLSVSSCQDVIAPRPTDLARLGSTSGANDVQPFIDWFSCGSWDQGQTWNCVYTHTEANDGTPDYWDPFDAFHTTKDCYLDPSYCDLNFQPEGSPYSAPRNTGRADEADNAMLPVPTCPPAANALATIKAYCKGAAPTTLQRTRIQDALDRMLDLGGECAALAAIGNTLLNRPGAIRVYAQGSYKFGGAAPQGGGSSGPNSWLIISQDFTDRVYDAPHYGWSKNKNSPLSYKNTLQAELAHELDHLNGQPHIQEDGVDNTVLTTNMRACADIDMGPGIVR